jgi:hypothetical protein
MLLCTCRDALDDVIAVALSATATIRSNPFLKGSDIWACYRICIEEVAACLALR